VIPAQATAKVSLRLVPGHSVAKVEKQLRREVEALAPKWAEVEVKFLHGGEPVHMDLDHPIFEVLDEAFESVVGQAAVRVRAGGSIPVVTELAKGGAPVLLTGIGLPDDRLHAPNEKLDLQQLWDGIQVFGKFFELMGESEFAAEEKEEK
jgi:acetylornithine deacetylase/succinyl-diaminopimelate desuccinylase-like protein